MRDEIRERIEAVKRGEVPEGYKRVEGYTVPKEWDVTSFDSLFERSTRKNDTGCENVLTISAQMGLVSQREYYEKDIASEDKSGYFLLKSGDYAYNKSYSAGYPYGAIKQLVEYDEGIVSPLYICFTPKAGTNTSFYSQYFEGGMYNREIYRFAQEGARNHGLLNIPVEDFFTGALIVPSQVEQRRITEVLDTCDRVIKLKQELIEGKRKQKQNLMTRLLDPAEGSLDNEYALWTEITIGSECLTFSGGTPSAGKEEFYKCGTIPFIRSAEIGARTTELYLTELGFDNSAAKMVQPGDILYALYGANSGDCAISKIHGAINQAILCIRPKTIDRELLYYALCYKKDSIVSTYLQGGQGNLSAEIIKSITLKLPQNPDYIKRTICILHLVDRELEGLEEELVLWQQKKKALMQLLLTGLVRVNA